MSWPEFMHSINFMNLWDNYSIYFHFDSPWHFIRTIIDIMIVAYIVYKLLMITRETRAWQLLKGILFVVIFARVSELLGLQMLQVILDNTIQYIALAVIVVFQPELRRGLEQIGRSKFYKLFFNNQNQEVQTVNMIESIVIAAERLAETKTGALIVLEGNTKLGDVMDDGTELDSKVSWGLLINIFALDTPLHDGAVVIRNNRIEAAGCYLPLAKNTVIPKELGTRHRAAIGISEVSDSLSLVVSEETGQISIAMEGNLQRGLSPDLLRAKLRKQLQLDEESNKKSISIFRRKEGKKDG